MTKKTDEITAFDVYLNETHVGQLSYLRQTNMTTFILSQGYMSLDKAPILSQCYRNKIGGFSRINESTMVSLPAFFANLLPEPGLLRSLLIKRGSLEGKHDFELLSLLREDLPGAVLLRPAFGQPETVVASTNIVADTQSEADGQALHFSLAGVQLKFSGSFKDGRLSIPVTGAGGDWILKVPNARFPCAPENEYAVMTFAQHVGIEIPEVVLLGPEFIVGIPSDAFIKEGKSYAIKRFDRTGTDRRVHMEDFAQVFHLQPKHKYEKASYRNIAEVVFRECGDEGLVEFIKRLVFSIIMGNTDMHLKNWSLLYSDPGSPRLAPAYDLMSTVVYPEIDKKLALSLSKTKDPGAIGSGHFRKLVADASLPEALVMKTVEDTGAKIASSWPDYRSLFPNDYMKALEDHMQRMPLLPRGISVPVVFSETEKIATSSEGRNSWLEKTIAEEFGKVQAPLSQIRKQLQTFSSETSWLEERSKGTLAATFQAGNIQILLNFGGWLSSQGSQIELMATSDTMILQTVVGPHLIVKFKETSGIDKIILGFRYIVYNGSPGWEALTSSKWFVQFQNTEKLIVGLKGQIQELSGSGGRAEHYSLDIQYVTAGKKLLTIVDNEGQIRGSSLLANAEINLLLARIKPGEKLALPNQPSLGIRVGAVDLAAAKREGLLGRFISDREKELASKELIQEFAVQLLFQYNKTPGLFSYWKDEQKGALLCFQKDNQLVSQGFTTAELLVIWNDPSAQKKAYDMLYRTIRNFDPLYRVALQKLLTMRPGGVIEAETKDDVLNVMKTEQWIEPRPKTKDYWLTTKGMLEGMRYKTIGQPGNCTKCEKSLEPGEGTPTPNGIVCRRCFFEPLL